MAVLVVRDRDGAVAIGAAHVVGDRDSPGCAAVSAHKGGLELNKLVRWQALPWYSTQVPAAIAEPRVTDEDGSGEAAHGLG